LRKTAQAAHAAGRRRADGEHAGLVDLRRCFAVILAVADPVDRVLE
jgi:hypothetical protein